MRQPAGKQKAYGSGASQQPAGGASGASSSSSASFLPCRDGGAPREIPSNDGGSNVSRVVHEFSIGEIRVSTVIVVNPLALPPSLPPSDAQRALLVAAAPAANQLRLQQRCGGWCDEKRHHGDSEL